MTDEDEIPIYINSVVLIKEGAEIRGFTSNANGALKKRVAGRNYKVTVIEVFREGKRDEIHWQSRHGHWSFTDRANVTPLPMESGDVY